MLDSVNDTSDISNNIENLNGVVAGTSIEADAKQN